MRGLGERRRPGHYRICGSCGKRNKARRKACAKCGEPLRGIPEARPGSVRAVAAPPRKYRWWVTAAVLVAVAAGIGVHRLFRGSVIVPSGQTLTLPSPVSAAPEGPDPLPDGPSTTPAARADARAAAERGERLLARGDARGAASHLAEAARLAPEDARIANAYGRALLGLGSRDRALHQFEKAARLATGVVPYRLDYARALGDAGRRGEAAREYTAIAALEPGNAAAAAALSGLQSPAPGTDPPSMDLGGAARAPSDAGTERRTPPAGGVFTNEDLSRGTPRPSPSIPASLRSPSPRMIVHPPPPSPPPPSPSPSPS